MHQESIAGGRREEAGREAEEGGGRQETCKEPRMCVRGGGRGGGRVGVGRGRKEGEEGGRWGGWGGKETRPGFPIQ